MNSCQLLFNFRFWCGSAGRARPPGEPWLVEDASPYLPTQAKFIGLFYASRAAACSGSWNDNFTRTGLSNPKMLYGIITVGLLKPGRAMSVPGE